MKEYMSQKKAGVFTKYLIDGASVLIERVSVNEGLWLMFEAELSSIYRSTSTSTIASSEDALASLHRSQVSYALGRRLRARQAQR